MTNISGRPDPSSSQTPKSTTHAERDLRLSLLALALAFAAVLAGLAHDENWRKLLRIAIAACVYLSTLIVSVRLSGKRLGRLRGSASAELAFWPFALAAASAELASGWLRTGVASGITFWLAPIAACLIGGTHWLALRSWRPLRARITESRTSTARRVA